MTTQSQDNEVPSPDAAIEALPSFRAAIGEAVAACNGSVLDRVVDHFVKIEVERRTPILIRGLSEIDKVDADIKKIRPDQTFDLDGNVLTSSYTKGILDQRNKLIDRLSKLRSAMNAAITDGNFEPLEKALKGSDQNSSQQKD